jgi:hypothetical protein
LLHRYKKSVGRGRSALRTIRLRDASDPRFREKKCFAGIEPELNVCVVDIDPSGATTSDELSDAPHHKRFRRINADFCIDARRDLAFAKPSTRTCVEPAARRHCPNPSLLPQIERQVLSSPGSASGQLNDSIVLAATPKLKRALHRPAECQIDAHASHGFVTLLVERRHAMKAQAGRPAPHRDVSVSECEPLYGIAPFEAAELECRR